MPAGSNQVVSEFYPLKRREIRAQFDGRESPVRARRLGGKSADGGVTSNTVTSAGRRSGMIGQ